MGGMKKQLGRKNAVCRDSFPSRFAPYLLGTRNKAVRIRVRLDSRRAMMGRIVGVSILSLFTFVAAYAQVPDKIDFSRDVQPIFRQNCVTCHGPSQQMNGLRVDRKSSVFSGRRVVSRSLENSFLYRRLVGSSEFGSQMPPTGPLKPEQVEVVKRWVEQGAEWPDALAN